MFKKIPPDISASNEILLYYESIEICKLTQTISTSKSEMKIKLDKVLKYCFIFKQKCFGRCLIINHTFIHIKDIIALYLINSRTDVNIYEL